ncbi:MAG: flagellar export chaperone FliS [Planctomycetaceae bacterium]|nr:flagellar export chaperone FliS [Planctomycetaceae bacterium]
MQTAQKVQKTYLESEVSTATPQKIQLLLIEAAIKNIHRVKRFWETNDTEGAFQSLTRVQDIVAEILCSLDMKSSPEIAQSLAAIYVFIFRKLVATRGPEDMVSLDDALKVLMAERQSWKEICEKFGVKTDATKHSATFDSKTQDTSKVREIKPKAPHTPMGKTVSHAETSAKRSWDV